MAWKYFTYAKRASDLLIDHLHYNFSNDKANITPPAAGAAIPFGTVVFRAKGLGSAAPWAAVAASADVADTNEFGVVWGDHYAFAIDFVPRAIAAGKFNSIVIKRDAAFKEYYIKQVHATALGAVPYDLLKQLMADQGLLVLDDVSDYTVA